MLVAFRQINGFSLDQIRLSSSQRSSYILVYDVPTLTLSNCGHAVLWHVRPRICLRSRDFTRLLGAFAYSRKALVTFLMSVCLFVDIVTVPTGRIFVTFDIGDSLKSVEGIKSRLQSDKNIGRFTWRLEWVLFFPVMLKRYERSVFE